MQSRRNWEGSLEIATDLDQPLGERHKAFTAIVTEFQDMAFGNAYALLGQYATAEDAAQDAFICAWQNLGQVRDSRAFPGWLRQIVVSQCHRRLRRRNLPTVPLDDIASVAASGEEPQAQLLRRDAADEVHKALNGLPEKERQVTILFYIADYSQAEIAAFTGMSVVSVRKRLAAARRRLQERMLVAMHEELKTARPSHDDAFSERVTAFSKLFSALVMEGSSLSRSFEQLISQETNSEFRTVIEDVYREIRSGNCLSQAMAKHPRFFAAAYVQAIREGELKGVLEIVLQRLANGTYVLGTIPSPSFQANAAEELMQFFVHLAGHAYTEPEHALLGLLMSGENQSIRYLKSLGISTWKLKSELQQHLVALPKGLPYEGASSSLKEVHRIEAAEAKKDEAIVVGTLYLLLGLTLVESAVASRLLREAGVTAEGVRAHLAGEGVTETGARATD